MKLASTFITFAQAYQVLSDPEIIERTSEDGADLDDLTEDEGEYIIGTYLDDLLIGVWRLTSLSSVCLEVHCHILKAFRVLSYDSWAQVFELIDKHLPEYVKFNAKIPVCFPEVYHFSKNIGMKDEGVDRHSIRLKGELFDQWLVGGTREEMINGQA